MCRNKKCNDGCKPKCDVCSKQNKSFYCGQPIECIKVNRGDPLEEVIKKLGDSVCRLSGLEELYTYVEILEDVESCGEGFTGYTINVRNSKTDVIESSTTMCIPIIPEPPTLTQFSDGSDSYTPSLVSISQDGDIIVTPTYDEITGEMSYIISFEQRDILIEDVSIGNSTLNFKDSDTISTESVYNPLTGETELKFNCNLEDTPFYYEVTKAELDNLITQNELEKGATYFLTDKKYAFQAITENKINPQGTRIQRVPKSTYFVEATPSSSGGGIIYPGRSIVAGRHYTWGGKVWTADVSGVVGGSFPSSSLEPTVASTTGDNITFTEIPSSDLTFYEDKLFNILWNKSLDKIVWQSDERGNKVYADTQMYNRDFIDTYVTIADWNNPNLQSNTAMPSDNLFSPATGKMLNIQGSFYGNTFEYAVNVKTTYFVKHNINSNFLNSAIGSTFDNFECTFYNANTTVVQTNTGCRIEGLNMMTIMENQHCVYKNNSFSGESKFNFKRLIENCTSINSGGSTNFINSNGRGRRISVTFDGSGIYVSDNTNTGMITGTITSNVSDPIVDKIL